MNPEDILKKDKLKLSVSTRPSFTLENANRFRPIFDSLIENPRDVFINPASLDLAFSTLKHRMPEALRWLMADNHSADSKKAKYKADDYILLRAKINFTPVVHEVGGNEVAGIMLKFKVKKNPVFDINDLIEGSEVAEQAGGEGEIKSVGGGKLIAENEIKSFESKRYRAKVLEFLENSEVSYLHIKGAVETGGNLGEEDRIWIENTFEGTGIEFEIGPQEIKAVK